MAFEEALFGVLENSLEEYTLDEQLSQDQAGRFCAALRRNYSLVSLELKYSRHPRYHSLSRNFVLNLLPDALKANDTLANLNLSYNAIGDQNVELLAKALTVNNGLRALDLTNNLITNLGALYLSRALGQNKSLATLNLKFNDIGTDGASHFAISLLINKSLTNLSFDSNNINDGGAEHMADVLKVNDTLLHLNLTDNNITASGAVALAEGLRINHSLIELCLSTNLIEDEAGIMIADALKVNTTLRKIDLNYNYIANKGAECISESLIVNKSLTELSLDSNDISDQGAKRLSQALEQNKTIIMLKLNEHFVSSAILREISEKLEGNVVRKSKMFLDTLNGDQRTALNRSRLMVVGQGHAGKSATVRSLLGLPFKKEWDSTIGADITESMLPYREGSSSQTFTWTKLKQDDNMDYSSKFAARIMLQKQSSIEKDKSQSLIAVRKRRIVSSHHIPRRNKTIPSDRSTQLDNFKEQGAKRKTPEKPKAVRKFDVDLLVDAENNANNVTLSLWDFGGQEVFYSMHNLFLTKSGVYVLVFDMRELLQWHKKNEAISYISFWIRSIRLHAPHAPLFLVGTFLRDIQSHIRGVNHINTIITKLVTSLGSTQVVRNISSQLCFFPIDNKERIGITELRYAVESSISNDPNVKQEVSIRWILLLDEILSTGKEKSYVELATIMEMARKFGIGDSKELSRALALFHKQGMLLHLTATEVLRNIVVTKPQWLIDSFSMVIRDQNLHAYNLDRVKSHGLEKDLICLREKGLVSLEFLQFLWSGEQVPFLIDMMKRTLLISEWGYSVEEQYLVPSLLNRVGRSYKRGYRLLLDFSRSFLPIGAFQRLICLVVAQAAVFSRTFESYSLEAELYRNCAFVEIEPGFKLFLQEEIKNHKIYVRIPSSKHAARGCRMIAAMVNKLNCDVMGEGLKWDLLVEDTNRSTNLVPYQQAVKQKLFPWFEKDTKSTLPKSRSINLDSFLSDL